jgi:CheY-like chemotaxis protein
LEEGTKMPISDARTRVLVVDDERVIADSLALILNKSGFEARAVYSGERAVEVANMLQPQVLISDIVMEGMNGIQTAILISGSWPNCRVILFSGNAATADLLQHAAAEGHCFELLSKPIHPRVLIDHLSGPQLLASA